MYRATLIVTLVIATLVVAVSACGAGDKACHCKQIGGEWRPAESILAPACRIYYNHQGQLRVLWHFLRPALQEGFGIV